MADVSSETLSVADAAEVFQALIGSLHDVVGRVVVDGASYEHLIALLRSVRHGQHLLDRMVARIVGGAESGIESGGRGARSVLLGDGSQTAGRRVAGEIARASALAALPAVAEAFHSGAMSSQHVDVFARALARLPEAEQFELNDADLVAAATRTPVDTFNRLMGRVVDEIKGDHGLADANDKRERSSWKMWFNNETGMGHITGEFDPVRFEAIADAVNAHVNRLANQGGVQKNHNLAAAAAFDLITGVGNSRGSVPHISVVIDHETFAHGPHDRSVIETSAGHPVAPETVARLACDAMIRRIVLSARGVPIDVGRGSRTATDAQWHAARAIYRSCAWDGCQRPLSWCQLHHILEWEHGGPTDMSNLVPLCSHHHHQVHEGGWKIKLGPDRRLDIYNPAGEVITSAMPDRHPDRAPP